MSVESQGSSSNKRGPGRPRHAKPRKPRQIRLTDDQWTKLRALAAAAGTSPARWVEAAIAAAAEPS